MVGRWTRALLVTALLAFVAALALAVPARAGGWVVITLDRLPDNIVAGEAETIAMMARQHGKTAWEADSLQVQAKHIETGQQITFTALPEGEPGRYIAELVFPLAGDWEWSIGAGMFPEAQPMPALTVYDNPAQSAEESGTGTVAPLLANTRSVLMGAGALLAFAAGLRLILRARSRRMQVLAGAGLMVLCAGLAFASYSSANAQPENHPKAAVAEGPAAVEDPVLVGQKLFLSKGCVVCHTNDRAIKDSATYGTNMGPNLTQYRNDPTIIHTKLKDPKATNPAAQMPQLYLKVDEIEALVAFINNSD